MKRKVKVLCALLFCVYTQQVCSEHINFTVQIPVSESVENVAVGAMEKLRIASGAKILDNGGQGALIVNSGSQSTLNDVESKTGSVVSLAGVDIRDRAIVDGDIVSAQSIALGNNTSVSGVQTSNAAIDIRTLSWSVEFPASLNDFILTPDSEGILHPGAYRKVTAFSRSRLRLASGAYYMDELVLEPQSHIVFDTRSGPVFLYVRSRLIVRGETGFDGPQNSLLIAYAGNESPGIDKTLKATLVAPNAEVRLGTGGQMHYGAVFAKSVDIDPNVNLVLRPFGFWDDIVFNVVPVFTCVSRRPHGTYAGVFGYENPNDQAVTIPVGPNNNFLPDAENRRQPTTFFPGRHDNALSLAWVNNAPAWSLNKVTAEVDFNKTCENEINSLAVSDSTVREDDPRRSYGAVSSLEVSGDRHALVEFDRESILSRVGRGQIVSKVTLQLRNTLPSNGNMTARPMIKPWVESSVTWNCADDRDSGQFTERCTVYDSWDMQPATGSWDGAWDPGAAGAPGNSVDISTVQFDVTGDAQAFLYGQRQGSPMAWAIVSNDGLTSRFASREMNDELAPRLLIEFYQLTDFDTHDLEPFSFAVDTSLTPSVSELPPYSDGGARPVVRLLSSTGEPLDFVSNEIYVVTDDAEELDAIKQRWDAVEVYTLSRNLPLQPATHVLRVDLSLADPDTLAATLSRSVPYYGLQRASSEDALRLLAIVTEEIRRGSLAGINFLMPPDAVTLDGFVDGQFTDGTASPGSFDRGSNALTWAHLVLHRVDLAWERMFYSGKLTQSAKVPVGILDGGYPAVGVGFLDGESDIFSLRLIGNNLLKPWHGLHVANAGFAEPNNFFAGAGPGGPVSAVTLAWGGGFPVVFTEGISDLTLRGNRIINVSSSVGIPWYLFFTAEPGEISSMATRQLGTLIFGSAGNHGSNIDQDYCYTVREPVSDSIAGLWGGEGFEIVTVCPWEESWRFPCENRGVHCVGATEFTVKDRASDSNFGDEDVDYWATGTAMVSGDPDNFLGSQYQYVSGTSFSTPFISGIAALVWASDLSQGAGDIETCLQIGRSGGPAGRFVDAYLATGCALGNPDVLPPFVEITAPRDGENFDAPGLITLNGRAGDIADGELTITWSSNVEGFIGIGNSVVYAPSGPGARVIRASAINSAGRSGADEVTILFEPSPPVVRITQPELFAEVHAGLPEHYVATVLNDSIFPGLFSNCDSMHWAEPVLNGTAVDMALGAGCGHTYTFLSPGSGEITAFYTNASGTGNDTARVNVIDDGRLRTRIVTPGWNDLTLGDREAQALTAAAVPVFGSDSYTYTWFIDLNGQATQMIATGGNSSWTPGLGLDCDEEVDAVLTVEVADSLGNIASDSIEIEISGGFCEPE
ncbi:MAG TPA: S8 family serine peptidase [Gammaproteobacteria bacterium]